MVSDRLTPGVDLHEVPVVDGVAETDFDVELPGIHAEPDGPLLHDQNVLGDGYVAEDLANGPHLVVLVLFEAVPVNEVAAVIG